MNRETTPPASTIPKLALALIAFMFLACAINAVLLPQQAHAAGTTTIKSAFGVSRLELVTWLESHEHDKYYLTTPYKPYDWRSPNGDINSWGADSDGKTAGMNCTGFVWHALCAAHKWKGNIAKKLPGLTGWATAIKDKSLKSYTYKTKKKLLASGRLEKGDIIWMWEDGDSTKTSSFHHVGIFWGDKPDEDRMWHSSGNASKNWAGKNAIGKIKGKASKVTYQIIKLGGSIKGAISLQKVSADESVTKGNDNYSLQGAEYGVFETEADAKTHTASKAIKTYSTDSNGAFTTAQDFRAGTYYVAETAAPPGYQLDDTVYAVQVTAGKTVMVNGDVVKDVPALGAISLHKVSADESVTKGNDNYSLQGAEYGVFDSEANAATHAAGKATKTFKTDAAGTFSSELEFRAGTHYVAEIKPPPGYKLDDKVYAVKVEAGKTVKVNGDVVKDVPLLGGIKLVKKSANASITDSNRCYSLKGAVYGLFKQKSDADTHATGKALKTYTTGSDGAFSTPLEWAAGTYYVSETSSPTGYTLDQSVYTVKIKPGESTYVNGDTGFTTDTPKSNPVTLWAAKRDTETPDKGAQGSATLSSTLFEIAYYDGYYDLKTLPSTATRTWVVKSADDGKAYARDDLRVSGDDFYHMLDGRVTIPLGTVTVREKQAPYGYLLGDGQDEAGGRQLIVIKSSSAEETIGAYTAPDFSDYVMRGGVAVGKVDRQNGLFEPQGAASLKGARFSIISENDQQVLVDGARYTKGEVVASIETTEEDDGRFVARTPEELLPVGNYTLVEVETSEGYLLDDESRDWKMPFEISEHRQVVDLTDPESCVSNQVVRGDFGFSKVDGQTDARLGLIPFMVTSQTTGEKHVIMTDENGMVSTASGWNPHSARPNSNDDAVSDDETIDGGFKVDEEKLDPTAGVWFSGRVDSPVQADDDLGALPYDTYEVSELRASTNTGYDLATFTVRISRNARELDLGTVDDNPGPIIGTTLTDGNNVKLAPAGSIATLVDTVGYDNLDMREAYKLYGELHLVTEDGDDAGVVAEASIEFSPQSSHGDVDVPFSIDTSDLQGARLVAFEKLARSDGVIVATHEDIGDEGQTVHVPSIGTTLMDGFDGDHEAEADEAITLVDVVDYEGLTPGATYTMAGELHVRGDDGSDEGLATDEMGRAIVSRQSFTPTEPNGQVEVPFTFAAPNLAGKAIVAFEELTRNDRTYATHADISDGGQTIWFAPAHAEKGQPPDYTPQTSKTPNKQLKGQKSPQPERSGLPRTGDALVPWLFAIAALAATAALALALYTRHRKRCREFDFSRRSDRR